MEVTKKAKLDRRELEVLEAPTVTSLTLAQRLLPCMEFLIGSSGKKSPRNGNRGAASVRGTKGTKGKNRILPAKFPTFYAQCKILYDTLPSPAILVALTLGPRTSDIGLLVV